MHKNIEISFADKPSVPKYRQIIDSVILAIQTGKIKKGDRIASLNYICRKYQLSQDTVLAAYNELKLRGILTSIVGKGYYILNENAVNNKINIFLLFDKLTPYKEVLYESLRNSLDGNGSVQIFFHHNNTKIFQTIIESEKESFTHYVIMPIANEEGKNIIQSLPQHRVYLLDQGRTFFKNEYPFVCQNYEKDIFSVLIDLKEKIKKYKTFILVIKNQKSHYQEIISGFKSFCKKYKIQHKIIDSLKDHNIEFKAGYIVVDDNELIELVKLVVKNKYELAKDVGIISYNESPLKEVISTGISTVSTDFEQMGKSIIELILSNQKKYLENPFNFIDRKSF